MPIGAILGAVAGPILGSIMGSGSSPPNVSTSGTQTTQLPPWYTSYLQGALGTGESLASRAYPQYTGQRLAGFTDPQMMAFSDINNAQGNWSPLMQASMNNASSAPNYAMGAMLRANNFGSGALGAASRPIQQWNDPGVAQSWMNPYTQNVVNAIAQQGNQNWQTNIMPSIESQFIANGNPNSMSNAAALGVGAAQNNQNIINAQSNALMGGYNNAMQGFQTGQGQQLQQSGLQANAGLGAAGLANASGQLGVQGALGAASALGQGANSMQNLTYNDINQLMNMGNQQQNLAQTGYNTAYQNFMNQVNWPMQQLSWLNSIATGAQLPTSTSATGSAPLAGATYGPSPLAYAGAGAQLGSQYGGGFNNLFGGLFGSNSGGSGGNTGTAPLMSGTGYSSFTGGDYSPGFNFSHGGGVLARASNRNTKIEPPKFFASGGLAAASRPIPKRTFDYMNQTNKSPLAAACGGSVRYGR